MRLNAGHINEDPVTFDKMNIEAIPVNHMYNLRPRPKRIQDILWHRQGNNQRALFSKQHAHVMLTQISIKESMRKLRDNGTLALQKELNQLHERNAWLSKNKQKMSYSEQKMP